MPVRSIQSIKRRSSLRRTRSRCFLCTCLTCSYLVDSGEEVQLDAYVMNAAFVRHCKIGVVYYATQLPDEYLDLGEYGIEPVVHSLFFSRHVSAGPVLNTGEWEVGRGEIGI
jgi:hypothetical protein